MTLPEKLIGIAFVVDQAAGSLWLTMMMMMISTARLEVGGVVEVSLAGLVRV